MLPSVEFDQASMNQDGKEVRLSSKMVTDHVEHTSLLKDREGKTQKDKDHPDETKYEST